MPSIKPSSSAGFWTTVFILTAAVYWTLIPIVVVLNTEILGDADTDAISGMWSFDHVRRSMLPPETPIWSDQINFPAGVLALTLPWTTSVLLSPLGFFFGPVVAWNLSVAMILLAIGVSTAWLVKQLTDSWSIGCAMGGLVMTQPMLLHAISDGTPEHLSLWGVPLLLGMTWKAFTEISPKMGCRCWSNGGARGSRLPISRYLCCTHRVNRPSMVFYSAVEKLKRDWILYGPWVPC